MRNLRPVGNWPTLSHSCTRGHPGAPEASEQLALCQQAQENEAHTASHLQQQIKPDRARGVAVPSLHTPHNSRDEVAVPSLLLPHTLSRNTPPARASRGASPRPGPAGSPLPGRGHTGAVPRSLGTSARALPAAPQPGRTPQQAEPARREPGRRAGDELPALHRGPSGSPAYPRPRWAAAGKR